MSFDRRGLMTVGLALGAAGWPLTAPVKAAPPTRARTAELADTSGVVAPSPHRGVVPDLAEDQSQALQAAIDAAAERSFVLHLPAGRYLVRNIRLRPGLTLTGVAGRSTLVQSADGSLVTGERADGVHLAGLGFDGNGRRLLGAERSGLLTLRRSSNVHLNELSLVGSSAHGVMLQASSGRLLQSTVSGATEAGIFSLDAAGLEISQNAIVDCANNGILVWRSTAGEDGTLVTANRIERIRAAAGGSGQNGNGVNVYRADSVLVTGNRIADCAYSAIRGNAASNIQMVANSCQRLGEVALYAEFGFEGALIASNVVDGAASGIAVTNFNEGGRLAVVQGNLIRNLHRREFELIDKRGEGISVEADAAVTGNTIEDAPTAGLVIGWGPYMRDVAATANVIRNARVGIMITRDPAAGSALIASNLISGSRDGAIRAMDTGTLIGPDLARAPTASARITITGNAVA